MRSAASVNDALLGDDDELILASANKMRLPPRTLCR
jgi:hypothetical protein